MCNTPTSSAELIAEIMFLATLPEGCIVVIKFNVRCRNEEQLVASRLSFLEGGRIVRDGASENYLLGAETNKV